MSSDVLLETTRQDWREFGFFYDVDDFNRTWLFRGSRAGLSRFVTMLRQYCDDPKRQMVGERERYGPYMYLEIVTAEAPAIDESNIRGSIADLRALSDLVDARLQSSVPGQSFELGAQWAPESAFLLEFMVQRDDFDPASADPLCTESEADA